jgi:hypothetical protein
MNDYFVMALLLGVPGLGAVGTGAVAWSGRWRSWALNYVSWRFHTKRNYLPLQAGFAGFIILCAMVPLTATLEHWEHAGNLWTAFALVAMTAAIVTRFWWPHWLTPRWHKDWIRRGGDKGRYDVPLWGPDENPRGSKA